MSVCEIVSDGDLEGSSRSSKRHQLSAMSGSQSRWTWSVTGLEWSGLEWIRSGKVLGSRSARLGGGKREEQDRER